MNPGKYIIASTFGLFTLCVPLAFANAASVSIASLSPGQTVTAHDRFTFIIVPVGFTNQTYQFSDSFRSSSASLTNISGAGNFFWVPLDSDVGTHVFTINVQDNSGNAANVTQTVTVLPAPTLSIHAVSPGTAIMPGTKFSFSVTASGFTNPSYSIGDSFSGSSVRNTNLDASGNFSWTPDQEQNGDHIITIYAYDSTGHSASIAQAVRVGVGPTLSIILLSPGARVPVGTTTSFIATPRNFEPTSFNLSDSFKGSTISNNNITTTGQFSWMPQTSDIGVHLLTIRGVVGTFGQSTTTTQKITVFGSANPAAVLPASNGYIFKYFMGFGEDTTDGADVLELQKRLAGLGFLSGTPTGYFGSATQQAVKKFQAAHGIPATGYVGSLTRATLNK